MRRLLLPGALVLLTAAGTGSAQFERAKKYYDKGDHESASIELTKIVGDDQWDKTEREEAQLLLAKTFLGMKLPLIARDELSLIVQAGPKHASYLAAVPSFLAVEDALHDPSEILSMLRSYSATDLADRSLDAFRPRLTLDAGIIALREGRTEDAIKDFESLASVKDKAIAERADELAALAHADAAKLSIVAKTATDPAIADRAALAAGRIDLRVRHLKDAKERYALAPSPGVDRAFEQSEATAFDADTIELLKFYAAGESTDAGSSPSTLEIAIYADACTNGAQKDAFAELRDHGLKARDEINAFLQTHADDSAELGEAIALESPPKGMSQYTWTMIRFAVAQDAPTRRSMTTLAEIDEELARFSKMDKAWQTTSVASTALQTLTILQSLAQSEAGMQASHVLQRVASELPRLVPAAKSVTLKLASGEKAGKKTLVFQKSACPK
jgi:hypothetical protein